MAAVSGKAQSRSTTDTCTSKFLGQAIFRVARLPEAAPVTRAVPPFKRSAILYLPGSYFQLSDEDGKVKCDLDVVPGTR